MTPLSIIQTLIFKQWASKQAYRWRPAAASLDWAMAALPAQMILKLAASELNRPPTRRHLNPWMSHWLFDFDCFYGNPFVDITQNRITEPFAEVCLDV
jgi:hypothetical protein